MNISTRTVVVYDIEMDNTEMNRLRYVLRNVVGATGETQEFLDEFLMKLGVASRNV